MLLVCSQWGSSCGTQSLLDYLELEHNFTLLYADFDVNQQHLLRLRSWIHQNVSEFHGESDGKALRACGRSENAYFEVVLLFVIYDVKKRLIFSRFWPIFDPRVHLNA